MSLYPYIVFYFLIYSLCETQSDTQIPNRHAFNFFFNIIFAYFDLGLLVFMQNRGVRYLLNVVDIYGKQVEKSIFVLVLFIDGIMGPGPNQVETGLYRFLLVARVCPYSKFWKLITSPHTSYIINIIGPFSFGSSSSIPWKPSYF